MIDFFEMFSVFLKHSAMFLFLWFSANLFKRVYLPRGQICRIAGIRLGGILTLLYPAKLLIITIVFLVMPTSFVITPDSERYLFEIDGISEAPFLWNPFQGTGPNYMATAKMGMSYIYGVVMYVFQVKSLFAIFMMNCFFSTLISFLVVELSRIISNVSANVITAAFLLSLVHPEVMFWGARVARESMATFCVLYLFLVSSKFAVKFRLSHLFLLGVTSLSLLLVRAQLILFLPLTLVTHLMVNIRKKSRGYSFLLLGVTVLASVLLFGKLQTYIQKVSGLQMTKVAQSGGAFSVESLKSVCTLMPTDVYGDLSFVFLPFNLIVSIGIFLFLGRLRKYLDENRLALTMLLVCIIFLFAMIQTGGENLRFRASIIPLLCCISCLGIFGPKLDVN